MRKKAVPSATKVDLDEAVGSLLKRIDDLDDSLRARLSAFSSEVLGRLDIFTDRMETLWRESKTLPQVIDEQGRQLGNHEARIKSLEGRTI